MGTDGPAEKGLTCKGQAAACLPESKIVLTEGVRSPGSTWIASVLAPSWRQWLSNRSPAASSPTALTRRGISPALHRSISLAALLCACHQMPEGCLHVIAISAHHSVSKVRCNQQGCRVYLASESSWHRRTRQCAMFLATPPGSC